MRTSTFSVRKLLKQAILENDFLNNLAQDQLTSLIDCMYPIAHKAGETLIREGEFGNMVYVLFVIWHSSSQERPALAEQYALSQIIENQYAFDLSK
ncbi:cGMP-dependent protein kinase [Fasciola gigantica]|uniref:cGMP-dependent protein kinase n=1 Tax=Fasciola gigantica TaxID=46835 RepID=A0A504YLL6_FASGI|nr:cGMP-dependent protein kinase [Fasciola gigantica]